MVSESLFDIGTWRRVRDGHLPAFAMFKRHYSYHQYADGRRDDQTYRNRNLFVGPGEKMILITPDKNGLFVWRKFIDDSGQTGVNCAVFRNESGRIASEMIREAELLAHRRWPGERFYTYVNPSKVKGNCPGYCFRRAGWKRVGETKKGLLIFAKQSLVGAER